MLSASRIVEGRFLFGLGCAGVFSKMWRCYNALFILWRYNGFGFEFENMVRKFFSEKFFSIKVFYVINVLFFIFRIYFIFYFMRFIIF